VHSFRLRFDRSPNATLAIDAPQWVWKTEGRNPDIVLCSPDRRTPIKDSKKLVLRSDGWISEAEAGKAAAEYVPILKVALAKLRVGADFGDWGPKRVWTEYGLAYLQEQTGNRTLNDVHGLMLYESNPSPVFVSTEVDGLHEVKAERFEALFSQGAEKGCSLSNAEGIAFGLFNASCFQRSADTRLLLLVMAIESLLQPPSRTPAALEHVASMIRATKESACLSSEEKASFLGSLEWLKVESIRGTGRRLAHDRLGDREYGGKKAADFFAYCYDLRSRLVHGKKPFPSFPEVNSATGPLEVFVSDLLTQPHLGLE